MGMFRRESTLMKPTGIHVGFLGRHFPAVDPTILPLALKVSPGTLSLSNMPPKNHPSTS